MRKKEKEEIPEIVKADLKAFDKWLSDNVVLKRASREVYLFQIQKLHNVTHSDITLDTVRKFVVDSEKARVYARKYALIHYLNFIGKPEWNEALVKQYKAIKLKVRDKDRDIGDFEAFRAFVSTVSPELRIILQILWDTSCRIGAVLNLQTKHIKESKHGLYLWLKEKRDKRIKRYLHKATINILNDYRAKNSEAIAKRNGYIFRAAVGNKFESKREAYLRYYVELKNASRKARLIDDKIGISFHYIRTTKILRYYEQYHDIYKVAQMVDHSNVNTTIRYISSDKSGHYKVIQKEGEIW